MGEIVERQRSYPLSRDVETEDKTGYRYIHYGDIHKQVADLITCDEQLPSIKGGDYVQLSQGDLVLADASEDYIGIAEPSVILHEPIDKVIAGLHTIALRPSNANSLFLYYLLHTEKFKKFGSHVGTGLKVFGITFNNLSLFETALPSTEEQEKVSNLLRTLDNTLTLHKRKCEALKRLKKAYLQMMFPQSRESVPRVRFKGFTGEWEQRNLGDVAEIASGGTPDTTNSDYWDGDIDWYSPVEIGKEIYAFSSQRKITELGLKKSSAKILPANRTILFTSRAGIGDMAILKNSAATNQGFQSLVVNNDFDVYFIYSMGSKIKEYALKNASGSTFLEISGKGLSKMDMLTPSTEEQTTIGNFFYNLDEQITTQQTKLNKLNQLKQAYLQKMFV